MSSPASMEKSHGRSQTREVPLPDSVEKALQRICIDQRQPMPDAGTRRMLADIGEESSLQVLHKISGTTIKRSLGGFIYHLVKQPRITGGSASPSPVKCPGNGGGSPSLPRQVLNFDDGSDSSPMRDQFRENLLLGSENGDSQRSSSFEALNELEFRKMFILLSYIGKQKLEQVISADAIKELKDLRMEDFESKVWEALRSSSDPVKEEDRCKHLEWDSGKTLFYHCHVSSDGSYRFKGPFLNMTRTLLQKKLGDENVLLVKLEGAANRGFPSCPTDDTLQVYRNIAKEGILVGSRRYRFFVFKDGGKEERKKAPTTSSVKCYFVHLEGDAMFANKSVHEARCLFMHVHTVSSLSNYMIRLSLILSKTISLEVDFARVKVDVIPDIECKDEKGSTPFDKKGKPLIHTDGTGFVSADIALKCPGSIYKGKCMSKQEVETFAGRAEQTSRGMARLGSHFDESPLLIQCRLFHEGLAVKGTLLVNNLLSEMTIQVRPSMIKVKKDPELSNVQTISSLEIVGTSNKPKPTNLSKTLIALLSYGGVPNDIFLDLLKSALGDAHGVFSSKRSALKVSVNHGEVDNNFNSARMILSGIPLEEPYLQSRLSILMRKEKKSLRGGKIPIPDSYYLMGTADPTGRLKPDEVCIILDCGQISGEVLVYRNPGLHFGDIHILKATYREELQSYVGNSKYAIFFPSTGSRSVADEIANGDFDGDMYWVSRNPQLLKNFKPSRPWISASVPQIVSPTNLSEWPPEKLEDELIDLWLSMRFRPSYTIGVAADSWQALMDRLLTIGDDQREEKDLIEKNLLQLIDLYYDALDQPKQGGEKIEVPMNLRADVFPHYMEKSRSYRSASILGLIYDTVASYQEEEPTAREIWKLPHFDVRVPESCHVKWNELYDKYRQDMSAAMSHVGEDKSESADDVIEKYKKILYGAAEFEDCPRSMEDVLDEALAIYNIVYDYAKSQQSVRLCGFAWKVAGPALCKVYVMKQGEKTITCLPSVLREIWS